MHKTHLWRISFDRRDNVVANGKTEVGRVTKLPGNGGYGATMAWDGEIYDAQARSKLALLNLLREAVGLVPREVALSPIIGGTLH